MHDPRSAAVDARWLAETRAAVTALGPTVAWDSTLGARAQAPEAIAAEALRGPRTVDAGALPLVSVAAEGASEGSDLVVKGRLGEGGMGIVELAHQRSLQRDVALKRVRPGAPPGVAGALLREAMFTGYLEHPSIVPVHALGRDADGRPVMMMKRLEGVSLEALCDDPAHPAWARAGGDRIGTAVEIGRALCDAIAYAHSRGVIHRDIKPANVMLGAFGEVVLLDWGIATRLGERHAPGAIAGTLAYMAPEMLTPERGAIDERTDVYLIGATLHHTITGAPPHGGATLDDVLISVASSAPPAYADPIPDDLATVLCRAMHHDPAARFESAAALGRALADHQRYRAAADLARVAAGRLADLEAAIARGAAPVDVRAIFHECRFAFEQSLRGFREGVAARSGRRAALVAMASFEIDQRNLPGAEALLADVDDAPPDLRARLGALAADAARAEADRARLRRMEHELSDEVANRERRIVVRLTLALASAVAATLLSLRAAGLFYPSSRTMGLVLVPITVTFAAVLYRWRAVFFSNRVNRQRAFTVAIAIALIGTNRTLGALAGRSVADVTSSDLLLAAGVAALSALTLRRVYLVPAALLWIASVVSPRLGEKALLAMLTAVFAGALVVLAAPKRLQRPALDREGEDGGAPGQ